MQSQYINVLRLHLLYSKYFEQKSRIPPKKALSHSITGKSLRTLLKANCPISTKEKGKTKQNFLRFDFVVPKLFSKIG